MTFHIGQKVVCIDDRPHAGTNNGRAEWRSVEEAPVNGQIYTVRSVHTDHLNNPVLWFNEIRRSQYAIDSHGPKVGYGVWRFRPLVDDHKGMTILRSILNDPQQFIRKDKFDKEKV